MEWYEYIIYGAGIGCAILVLFSPPVLAAYENHQNAKKAPTND